MATPLQAFLMKSGGGGSAPGRGGRPGPANPDRAASVGQNLGRFGSLAGMALGVPGLGVAGYGLGQLGVDSAFGSAYGFNPQTSLYDAANPFGGYTFGEQIAANTPGIQDTAFSVDPGQRAGAQAALSAPKSFTSPITPMRGPGPSGPGPGGKFGHSTWAWNPNVPNVNAWSFNPGQSPGTSGLGTGGGYGPGRPTGPAA